MVFIDILKNRIKDHTSGFTILEMMIVISIIGILMMVAYPNYDGLRKSHKVYSQARGLEVDLRYAWRLATAHKEDVKVEFDSVEGIYQIEKLEDGDVVKKGKLLSGIIMETTSDVIRISEDGKLQDEYGFDLTSAAIDFDIGADQITVFVDQLGGIDLR